MRKRAVLACIVRTASFADEPGTLTTKVGSMRNDAMSDYTQAGKNLCDAIAIPTVSATDAPPELAQFEAFHAFLQERYPYVHAAFSREVIAGRSLLYHWPSGHGEREAPIALLGHMDVVSVEPGTAENWTHPPFAGIIQDGYIWGRGANDMKNHLIALFESMNSLIAEGFIARRDIYILLGHNEEILEEQDSAAAAIAQTLEARGVHLAFVLDEGGAVITDPFMGLEVPIATIGIAEKGYCDLRITVAGPGGHAAEPPEDTAVVMLSRLLAHLPACKMRLTPTVRATFHALGQHKSGLLRFVLRHPKPFFPLIKRVLRNNKQAGAMLKTTCVPTILEAGSQANVLPQTAQAILNARLLPGETQAHLIALIHSTARRLRVPCTIETLRYSPAPRETSKDTPVYALLAELSARHYGAVALPYLVTGATDSREYVGVADEIYRFYPFAVTFEELESMHGTDERISCDSLAKATLFMREFIIKTAGREKECL